MMLWCYLKDYQTMRSISLFLCAGLLVSGAVPAYAASCDLTDFASTEGLSAKATADGIDVEWEGDDHQKLRLVLSVDNTGKPKIDSLSLWNGGWVQAVENAEPEFSVTTGLRRMSNQQIQPLRDLGVPIDQAALDTYRWDSFWDAPLDLGKKGKRRAFAGNPPPAAGIPGTDQPGLPRSPSEVETAKARYVPMACKATRDGTHLAIDLVGVQMAHFAGKLRFTVYQGTNLVRQEVLARTGNRWLAYKFSAGLVLPRNADAQVDWRDTGGMWQTDRFGGTGNANDMPLAARNRTAAFSNGKASLAFFPEPHKFFWAREIAINVGYQWLRNSGETLGFGIRQNDKEDDSEDPANWALYSARPGTVQRMALFLYPSLLTGKETVQAALAFTHNDTYKPLPGFKVLNHHYHTDLGERAMATGSDNLRLPDVVALKATGINIVSMVDSLAMGPAPAPQPTVSPAPGVAAPAPAPVAWRMPDQLSVIVAAYDAAAAQSDSDFAVWPNQEIYGSPFGGHTDVLFSHKVLWRYKGTTSTAKVSGKVYEVGSAPDLLAMAKAENAIFSMPHPRTKGSTGFPDAIASREYFLDPIFSGTGMRWGMGLDGSEQRLCEFRCWPLLDDMSNWMVRAGAPLKRLISISEVRHLAPGDDIYGSQPVTYIKLDRVPTDGNFAPVIDALQNKEVFWTTGEVLARNLTITPQGKNLKIGADVEWTFPLAFVEVHYGNGKVTFTKQVKATSFPANSSHSFEIVIPAKDARWVRFSAWDIASNGAVIQPLKTGR